MLRLWQVLLASAACGCGARTGLDVPRNDASVDATPDVATDVGGPPCDFGTIVSDVFGETVLWNGGAAIPAGHYRVTYVDGCMKYSSGQDWSVNAYADGPDTLYVVGNGVRVAPAPGTVGFLEGQGGFSSFDACVSANLANDTPLELDFDGGALGVRLADNPYTDNVPGENGRNPTYRLSSCP